MLINMLGLLVLLQELVEGSPRVYVTLKDRLVLTFEFGWIIEKELWRVQHSLSVLDIERSRLNEEQILSMIADTVNNKYKRKIEETRHAAKT